MSKRSVAGRPAGRGSGPLVIAIDGRSSEERAALAIELAARLRKNHKVSLMHLAERHPGWSGLDTDIEHYISTALTPLSRSEQSALSSSVWEGHHHGDDTRVTLPAEIVIIEGVGAAASDARHLLNAVIWVDSARDRAQTRTFGRDNDIHLSPRSAPENRQLCKGNEPGSADIQVLSSPGDSCVADVLELFPYLPALAPELAPELDARRGLRLRAVRLDGRPDAGRLFAALYGDSNNAVWLDSSNAPSTSPVEQSRSEDRSRFSIMADDGGVFGQTVTHRSGESLIAAGSATARVPGPFFRWLDTVWGRRAVRIPDGYPCDFALGWLGCLGYELKRETGGSDVTAATPDASLIFAGRAVVLDHAEGSVWLLALESPDADSWLASARTAVAAAAAPEAGPDGGGRAEWAGGRTAVARPPVFSSRDTEPEYKHKIVAAQHEIGDGNSYEVCLTTMLSARVPAAEAAPWSTYLALRRKNPAPFASYLRFGGLAVASTSPERFLKIASDGGMRAEPIKGTRRRASDPALDAQLRRDLETSLKDRAENIMIVDLLRNDLNHFAEPGSVTVSRLCAIESYATVHQMVSTIDAKLLPGSPRAEAVAACFPAGSMTGAPKISTMAILDRLEGAPRGLYSGAIGYFSLTGATDLAVAIRTLVINTGAGDDGDDEATAELTLGVGGAITSDSVPDEEYDEIRFKAFGVLSTLGAEFPRGGQACEL